MSTYELEDDLVMEYCGSAVHGPNNPASWARLRNALEAQLPIPVPTKIGAAVRATNGVAGRPPCVFVRWATDAHTHSPWLQANSDMPYRTDEIGRIVEVLSEGVDL